jgi:hypothetical protein
MVLGDITNTRRSREFHEIDHKARKFKPTPLVLQNHDSESMAEYSFPPQPTQSNPVSDVAYEAETPLGRPTTAAAPTSPRKEWRKELARSSFSTPLEMPRCLSFSGARSMSFSGGPCTPMFMPGTPIYAFGSDWTFGRSASFVGTPIGTPMSNSMIHSFEAPKPPGAPKKDGPMSRTFSSGEIAPVPFMLACYGHALPTPPMTPRTPATPMWNI